MIVALCILSLLILIVGWILFVPVSILVDSDRLEIVILQMATFRFCVYWQDELRYRLAIAGLNVPMRARSQRKRGAGKKDTTHSSTPKKSRKARFRDMITLVKRIASSVAIRKLVLDVDTDDVVANARLTPVCVFLCGRNRSIHVNYNGRVYMYLDARVKVHQVLFAFISFNFKKNYYGTEF